MKASSVTIGHAIPGAFEGDAHAFLMSVYKNPEFDLAVRIDAAGKAIRFEKPLLAAVDLNSKSEHVIYAVSDEPVLSPEQWLERCGTLN